MVGRGGATRRLGDIHGRHDERAGNDAGPFGSLRLAGQLLATSPVAARRALMIRA
jgi:hypothetical protein